MSYDPVNVGTYANDGTGEPIRDAFSSINTMLQELYTSSAANATAASDAQSDADTANAAITGLRSSGFMYLSASPPIAVAIASSGTFYGIGGTSDFTSAELVNFSLVNDGTNQVLQYDGTEALTAAEVHITVTAVASAGTKRIEVRHAKNGVASTIKGPIMHGSTELSVTYIAVVSLSTGDRLKPVLSNNDDTSTINVHRVSILVRR